MAQQLRSKEFRNYRPRCRRKLRLNRRFGSIRYGTKCVGPTSSKKRIGHAVAMTVPRAATG